MLARRRCIKHTVREYMANLRLFQLRQDASPTIALPTLSCMVSQKKCSKPGSDGLTRAFASFDRCTHGCPSEFRLRVVPSESFESRNRWHPINCEHIYSQNYGLRTSNLHSNGTQGNDSSRTRTLSGLRLAWKTISESSSISHS